MLHNDGKPAIQFGNGASFYACHGNIIPEQYGKIPLDQWKTLWLTEVDNFLRDILILGIGEEKICHELKTEEKINRVGVLTPNQKTLIPRYRYKWSKIAFSTDKCKRNLVKSYINRAYKYLKVRKTEVIFFNSPLLAQKYAIDNKLKAHLRKPFADNICKYACTLNSYIDKRIINEVDKEMNYIDDSYTYYRSNYRHLTNPVVDRIRQKFGRVIKCIKPESFIVSVATQDYLLFNFDCGEETERIKIFVRIMENCGWIYPYEEVCLVCERPINLHLDENYLLHAEGKPAIEYADGFYIYAHHGYVYLEHNS